MGRTDTREHVRTLGWTVVGLMGLLFIALFPLVGDAAEPVNVELIIDSSGSMAAKLDGRQKMAIAKDVVRTTFTRSIPANAHLAVRAYGHRRKDDCNDLELLTPFGSKNGTQITKTIQTLKPVGMTPITAALEAAGQDFAGREGQRNVIILVSDGKETCPGDPCAVARRLHEAGIQVQINVVGFDATAEERQQLECIAEAGGGKYYNADTAKELQGALAALQTQVAPAQPAAVPTSPPAKKTNLYTGALLQHIHTPGLKIEDVFKRVGRAVVEKTQGKQVPWMNSSLYEDVYFRR
jgi:hypothetical protein